MQRCAHAITHLICQSLINDAQFLFNNKTKRQIIKNKIIKPSSHFSECRVCVILWNWKSRRYQLYFMKKKIYMLTVMENLKYITKKVFSPSYLQLNDNVIMLLWAGLLLASVFPFPDDDQHLQRHLPELLQE